MTIEEIKSLMKSGDVAGAENAVRLYTNELTVTPDTPCMTAVLKCR